MPTAKNPKAFRARELRRSVAIPARVRIGPKWADACILNLSSRGLMISTAKPPTQGWEIEVCRAEQVIRARVMWRDGARVGLRADEPISVEDILSGSGAQGLHLTALGSGPAVERRRRSRSYDDNRLRGRAFEFAGVGLLVFSLASALLALAQQALARPIAAVSAALSG